MKVINADLPRELTHIELHTFADEHIGDANCDLQRLKERIEYVANTPNAFCLLNGDLLDNATKTSIGDCYSNSYNPQEQLRIAVDLFSPLRDKIIAIDNGNHENRTWRKEGIDLSYLLAAQLGITDRYSPTSCVIFLRFGEMIGNKRESNGSGKIRKVCYSIFMLHGSGGGRKEGAKVIRLADMASIIDCDIYLHAHTHLPMVMKQGFFRIDPRNSKVACVEKLFVNTASNLSYGGYGEAQEFKPSSKTSPIIYLSGKKKEFSARL